MSEAEPFIGRVAERSFIADSLADVMTSERPISLGVHVAGPEAIGKSALVRNMSKELRSGSRIAVVYVNLANPYRFDVFQRLLEIRTKLRTEIPEFNCDAFDFAALAFDHKYRDGAATAKSLRDSPFDPAAILEESVVDAFKSGATGAVEELKRAAVAAGAASGGAALTMAAVTAALGQALMGGFIAMGAIASYTIVKAVIRGAKTRCARRDLFTRYPELRRLVSAEDEDYEAFEALMARMLADSIAECQRGLDGYTPCILLDPVDRLATADNDDAIVAIGRALSRTFDSVGSKLVVTAGRQPLEVWRPRAARLRNLSEIVVRSRQLGPLPVGEVREWLTHHGCAEVALPPDALCPEGEGVWPAEFSRWWAARTSPRAEPQAREAEDEIA
jgi:Cdc6-like AAA superfamily ATPase